MIKINIYNKNWTRDNLRQMTGKNIEETFNYLINNDKVEDLEEFCNKFPEFKQVYINLLLGKLMLLNSISNEK